MRTLKFRRPHYDRNGKFSHFSYWGKIDHNRKPSESNFTSPTFNSQCSYKEDEQLTGIFTSKGKEVYEGDIFREELEHDYGDEREYSVVMWIRERGAFYLLPCDHYQVYRDNDLENDTDFDWLFDDPALYDFKNDCELFDLCGNIHANPEILEQ
jgi:hypothetical protein